ncbi:MAG: DUF3408 domain-containing protein [Alistipes sp.]|nr:DUF3408 domain-containing protein [Alistipes sp.]
MARDRKIANIDENMLREFSVNSHVDGSIANRQQPVKDQLQSVEPNPGVLVIAENRTRKSAAAAYTEKFLRSGKINNRRCVYISEKVKKKLDKYIPIITEKELTVNQFIENVLQHHLDNYKESLNELFILNTKIE